MMAPHRSSGFPMVGFELPRLPGSYVLLLMVPWETVLEVGALGEIKFRPGIWLYCGSARGPGGLSARLAHHARFADRPRWHIDHLRFAGSPCEVWYATSEEDLECSWADILSGMEQVAEGPPGFGASDCRCRTHLFHARSRDIFEGFKSLAGSLERAEAVRNR